MEIISINSCYYMENKGECRVCFKASPFLCFKHNYCKHESSICRECFSVWFAKTGQCDFCRKILFPCRQIAYVIIDEKIKIYTCRQHFIQSLKNCSKQDYNIIKTCAEKFEHDLNLIEKYTFEGCEIFFFRIMKINFFGELKKYFKKCNIKINRRIFIM